MVFVMIESINKEFNSEVECLSEIERLRSFLPQRLRHEVIPQELAVSNQWVVWKYKVNTQKNGKFRVNKQPCQPKNPFSVVSRNCPSDWSDLATALRCAKESPHIDGIGYLFVEGDGLIGIDLDNCRNPYTCKIREEYLFWIKKFGSYAEISPSGTGVKIWAKGTVSDNYFVSSEASGFRILNYAGGEMEIYRHGQYFVVTTQMINGFDSIKDAQAELDVICEFSQSITNWNSKYYPNPDDHLDAGKELSLLKTYWDEEKSFEYMHETEIQSNSAAAMQIGTLTVNPQLQTVTKNTNIVVLDQPRCSRCGKKCGVNYELCYECSKDGVPEESVENSVFDYFSNFQGLSAKRQHELIVGRYKPRPDVVLLDADQYPIAVAECKRGGTLDNGIEQLKSYLTIGEIQFGIFANSTEPDDWVFYENLRGQRFKEKIPRSQFETEIVKVQHIESFRQEKNKLESELTYLQEQLEKNKNTIRSIVHRKNKQNNELAALNGKLAELNNKIEFRLKEWNDLKQTNDSLKMSNRVLIGHSKVLESQKLEKTRDNLKLEISSLSRKKLILEDRSDAMQKLSNNLSIEVNTLKRQKDIFEKSIPKLELNAKKLKKEQLTWQKHKENRKTAKTELELEIKQLENEINKRCRAIGDLRRLSRLCELEAAFSKNSIYGKLEKELKRLEELKISINIKQQSVRKIQQKYATVEQNKVLINRKKQKRVQISQQRESILKQLTIVAKQLKTVSPEQKQQIESVRKQLVTDILQQKHNYSQISIEISQLIDLNSKLESENRLTEHNFSFSEIDILPIYLQIEEEIDILKAEKFELEAEIGHRIFELVPKND